MASEFFTFLLYLFYGMAFFAIGVSITSRDTHASHLKIANVLWLFALFAYSHAFHEWFELYENLLEPVFPSHLLEWINLAKLGLVFTSFGFLFLFGVRLLGISFPAKRLVFYLLPVGMVGLLLATLAPAPGSLTDAAFAFDHGRVRNFIGLPAALCAGLAWQCFVHRHIGEKPQPPATENEAGAEEVIK